LLTVHEVRRGGNKSFTAERKQKSIKQSTWSPALDQFEHQTSGKMTRNFTLFEGEKKFHLSSHNWNPFIIVKVIFQARELCFFVLAAVNPTRPEGPDKW
jgi:hypothetical protein